MKNASCFIFLFYVQKNSTIFQSGKFVKCPTCSLDSPPYTEHDNPQCYKKHHMNRLTHEYTERDKIRLNELHTHRSCQPRNDQF